MLKKSWLTVFLFIFLLSLPWSAGAATTPSGINLEAPQNLSVNVKNRDDGKPYFELKWINPQSAEQINAEESSNAPLAYQIDFRVGNGRWDYESEGDLIQSNSLHEGDNLISSATVDPIDSGKMETIDIKANTYSFRLRYSYEYDDGSTYQYLYSPFSNVASAGTSSFHQDAGQYQNASQWAVGQLDKAAQYGLITDSIKAGMNAPISREEFAELAVRLYEKSSGRSATAGDTSVFADTKNPEIFKAYNLGIISGTNKEKRLFSPTDLTNREQVSTMLYNTIKSLGIDTTNTGAARNFNDKEEISGYAMTPVAYMSGHGFISGSGGNFDPQGTCTREMAVVIAKRVYESSAAGENDSTNTSNTNSGTLTNQDAGSNKSPSDSGDNSDPSADNGITTNPMLPLPGGNGDDNGNGGNPSPQQPGVASNIFPLVSDALIHYVDEWDGGDGTVIYTSNYSITDLVHFYTDSGLYSACESITPIPNDEGMSEYMVTTATLQYIIYIGPNRDQEHGKQNVVQMCVFSNGYSQ